MGRRVLEATAIALMGVIAGVVVSHLLQWSPKAALSRETYLEVQQSLYRNYRNTIGMVELTSFFVLGAIAWLDRKDPRVLLLSLIALGCVAAMIAIWASGLNPINKTVNSWTQASMPCKALP